MNTKSLTSVVALAAVLGCANAFAQATDSSNPMPAPNQIVYLPQLPAAADLAKSAPSQGVTIAQITQTSDQLTIVYKLANGQTNAVQYRLLSGVDASAAVPTSAVGVPVPSTPAPAVAVAAPTTAVVYTAPAYPYYYNPYYYGPWYGPIGVSLGFGWGWHGGGGWGWRGGGWHGGGWHGR